MADPYVIKLIDCNLQIGGDKWRGFIDGGDGFLYGIPWNARKVLQIKIVEKSMRKIGPDLDGFGKYWSGVRAANGSIYCVPNRAEHFLKIITKGGGDAEVQILEDLILPEEGGWLWAAGALGNC